MLSIRKLFTHVDPRVRAAAVSAVGELAGPSLAPSVYPMLSDADADVRRAAQTAHRKILIDNLFPIYLEQKKRCGNKVTTPRVGLEKIIESPKMDRV